MANDAEKDAENVRGDLPGESRVRPSDEDARPTGHQAPGPGSTPGELDVGVGMKLVDRDALKEAFRKMALSDWHLRLQPREAEALRHWALGMRDEFDRILEGAT